ncbi:hypothetical protein PENSPDRAFT_752603 [Peniophora sp. CONT]|nr:hypothetical protein PENSPDRAFT_752603 [Peniophora sp. CONT]
MLPFDVLSSCLWLLWCWMHAPGSFAQDFTVPSNWKSTNANTVSEFTRPQLESLALGAAQTLVDNMDVGTGSVSGICATATASLAAVLALQDYYRGNTTWKKEVLEGTLGTYSVQHPNYTLSNPYGTWSPDILEFGLAAYYAYRTYNDSTALHLSMANWQLAYAYFMTTQRAKEGTLPGASNFTSICSLNLAGGVFGARPPTATNVELTLDSSGMMISLSGYLYNVTGNTTYLDAAELAGEFMQKNAYQPGHPIQLGINASDCAPQDTSITTWDTGLYLQGVAVLASITGNNSYQTILKDLVLLAVNSSWTNTEDGHITEYFPPSDLNALAAFNANKGIYIRALAEAARLNPGTPMAEFIKAYTTTQLHAITQSANAEGTNFYSASWNGPPAIDFDALGAIAVLDVLNPAFAFSSANALPAPSSTATPTPGQTGSTSSQRTSAGVIVGGVVGGMAGCAVLVLAIFFMHRRMRRNSGKHMPAKTTAQTRITDPHPYLLDHWQPTVEPLPKGSRRLVSRAASMHTSGPTRSQRPSARANDTLPVQAPRATRGRSRGDEVEAVFSEVANRIRAIRAVLNMRRRETDEPPPQYTR